MLPMEQSRSAPDCTLLWQDENVEESSKPKEQRPALGEGFKTSNLRSKNDNFRNQEEQR